jgi:hypothetical protein
MNAFMTFTAEHDAIVSVVCLAVSASVDMMKLKRDL